MPRSDAARLSVADAEAMFGAHVRKLAPTRQTFTNWKQRGMPWEIIGPLVMARLSQALGAHTQHSRHLGVEMHKVLDAQGRVFQLAARYGPDSREFRMLEAVLANYEDEPSPPTKSKAARKRGTPK